MSAARVSLSRGGRESISLKAKKFQGEMVSHGSNLVNQHSNRDMMMSIMSDTISR